MNSIDPATVGGRFSFDYKVGSDAAIAKLGTDGAIVDEGLATEHGLTVGNRFDVTSPKGDELQLTVRAIEKSPVLDALAMGPITISQAAFEGAFENNRNIVTYVSASDGAALDRALKPFPDAKARTEAAYIDEVTADIDSLLAIFYVLLALAVIVSLFGIVNTLVLSTFERTRELGTLRAVGMSRRQVRRMVRHESVITALMGAALGIAAGLGLAAIVTSGVRRRGPDVRDPGGLARRAHGRRRPRRRTRGGDSGAAGLAARRAHRARVRVGESPRRRRSVRSPAPQGPRALRLEGHPARVDRDQ